MAEKKIMAWSKCAVEIGKTDANDGWTSEFKSVGVVSDKSTNLESADGDILQVKSTGGELVGYEQQEGNVTLTCRVIEPTDAFFVMLGVGEAVSSGSGWHKGCLIIKSLVLDSEYSVRVTAKNVGARSFAAPKCSLSIKTGWSEELGNYADLTFGVLHGNQTEGGKSFWYKYFKSPGIVADPDNGGYKLK